MRENYTTWRVARDTRNPYHDGRCKQGLRSYHTQVEADWDKEEQ